MKFEDETIDQILAAFVFSGLKRMDAETAQFEYKVYWAGNIIRIDVTPKAE